MSSYEDFDLASLATYLHLTPAQVQRMADRGRLPGRKINGQWRFSQAEIHHWFEEKIGASDEQELVDVERVLGQQRTLLTSEINLVDLIFANAIAVPLLARTKSSVIEAMCELAVNAGLLWNATEMAEAIRNRESLHPTALENGAALLHPRRPMPNLLASSFLAIGITGSGIPFGGPRGALTDVFFLVASYSDPEHLRILARLSRLIVEPKFLPNLRNATNAADVIDIVRSAESNIR